MRSILILLLVCGAICSHAQIIVPNAGFELEDKTTATGAKGWATGGELDSCVVDGVRHTGSRSMKIVRTAPTGNGNFYQEMPFASRGLSKYKIRCAIKAKGLKGKAGLGARVFDKEGNSITGYEAFTITKDQDWKVLEGEFYSDEAAVKVRIFGKVEGAGTVWFDDITIEAMPLSTAVPAKKAYDYIDEYFDFIYKYSVVRDTPYLERLTENTLKLCSGHSDNAYFQNILKRYTTLKLSDGHSFFWTDEEWKSYRQGSEKVSVAGFVNYPTGYMTADKMAYISIPMFASLDTGIIHRYVDSMQSIIRMLDEQNPKGWILDISKNIGGNSFAMLAGLGPLLGNGICGYSQSADGSKRTRMYNNGYVGWFPALERVQRTPVYKLVHKDLPIALIYGSSTGSAGEVVAVSFRGMEKTRSFGSPTSGTTTRVDNLEMSDGAVLNLACGWDVDRKGVVYKSNIPPDVPTDTTERAIAEAAKWIEGYRK